MSLIAEYRFRSPKLALWECQSAVQNLTFEVVREVGTDPRRPFLFIRAYCDDFQAFERAMADDETVASFERYTTFDESVLYRLQVSEATELVIYPVWVEVGATTLEAWWDGEWWCIRVRYPDRDALTALRDWCRENDIEFELEAVYEETRLAKAGVLTPPQREALAVAVGLGYFEVPRQVSLSDVAAELGVSSQAASERLRRAHGRLVEHHLVAGDA